MHAVLIEFRNTTPYPVQLANALGKLCKITLLLPEAASGLADGLDRTTVDLCFFHMPRYREPANLAMVRDLRRQLRTLDPDLLHITFRHWWGTPGLGQSAPFPLVATVHDVSPHPGDGGWWRNPAIRSTPFSGTGPSRSLCTRTRTGGNCSASMVVNEIGSM